MPLRQADPGPDFNLQSTIGNIHYAPAKHHADRIVRNILMVGGVTDNDGVLGPSDTFYLIETLKVCATLDLPVLPQFDLHVSNLAYDDDFLLKPSPADLVIFAFIFHSEMRADKGFMNLRNPGVLQSDQAFAENVWHGALVKTGAMVAMNVTSPSCGCELPTSKLEGIELTHIARTLVSVKDDSPGSQDHRRYLDMVVRHDPGKAPRRYGMAA